MNSSIIVGSISPYFKITGAFSISEYMGEVTSSGTITLVFTNVGVFVLFSAPASVSPSTLFSAYTSNTTGTMPGGAGYVACGVGTDMLIANSAMSPFITDGVATDGRLLILSLLNTIPTLATDVNESDFHAPSTDAFMGNTFFSSAAARMGPINALGYTGAFLDDRQQGMGSFVQEALNSELWAMTLQSEKDQMQTQLQTQINEVTADRDNLQHTIDNMLVEQGQQAAALAEAQATVAARDAAIVTLTENLEAAQLEGIVGDQALERLNQVAALDRAAFESMNPAACWLP